MRLIACKNIVFSELEFVLPAYILTQFYCTCVSGVGRNGTFTANLRFRCFFCKIHFRDYSRATLENIRSKFAREPTYFQEFLDPTKKESATSINFIQALALLRYLERTAAFIHFVYQICALASTATLKIRCHNALQQAIDF